MWRVFQQFSFANPKGTPSLPRRRSSFPPPIYYTLSLSKGYPFPTPTLMSDTPCGPCNIFPLCDRQEFLLCYWTVTLFSAHWQYMLVDHMGALLGFFWPGRNNRLFHLETWGCRHSLLYKAKDEVNCFWCYTDESVALHGVLPWFRNAVWKVFLWRMVNINQKKKVCYEFGDTVANMWYNRPVSQKSIFFSFRMHWLKPPNLLKFFLSYGVVKTP